MNKKKTGGLLIGIILIIIGSVLLVKNEGNNVKNIKTVNDIKKNAISVVSDKIDDNNNGKLVGTSGAFLVEDEKVTDYVFNVSYKTAKLKRIVEVYQWEEETKNDGDDKTYTYKKVWSNKLIDSSEFNDGTYSNPVVKKMEDEEFTANNVRVGEYYLSVPQIKALSTTETLQLDESNINLLFNYSIRENYITNSEDLSNPQIGDIRIYYTYNNYDTASVLARQVGNTFDDYVSVSGKTVNRVFKGQLSVSEMVSRIQSENNLMKWLLRFAGCIIIIFGYIALFSGLKKLSEIIPYIGNIVSKVLSLIAALIGIIQSLVIILIAWFVYRPVLSIVLLIIVVSLITLIVVLTNKSKEKQATVANNIN